MSFPSSYFQSRETFRDLTRANDWRCESHSITPKGPNEETLSIDVAIRRPDSPVATLVVTSGLHGIEGFVGAAIQCETLQAWHQNGLPDDLNLIFIHALNPYGFAWRRRFDEHNVDPNRNFFSPGQTRPECSEIYRHLHPVLNPESAPTHFDLFLPRAALAIARYGYHRVARAVACGQYEYPKGLFYGGLEPSESQTILQTNLRKWIGVEDCSQRGPVLHIDFHSGLGTKGITQLLMEQYLSPERQRWLEDHFGAKSISKHDADELLYRAAGSFGQWCVDHLPEVDYTFACAEIGTYPAIKVLSGLRAENRATHWCEDQPTLINRWRDRLQELFCLADPVWRTKVLTDGCDILDASLNAIRSRVEFLAESRDKSVK